MERYPKVKDNVTAQQQVLAEWVEQLYGKVLDWAVNRVGQLYGKVLDWAVKVGQLYSKDYCSY